MWICSRLSMSYKKFKRRKTELHQRLRVRHSHPMLHALQYLSSLDPGLRLLEVLLHLRLPSRSKLHTNYDEATRATHQPASPFCSDLRPELIITGRPRCLRSDSRRLLSSLRQSKQYRRGLLQSKRKKHLSSSSHRSCKGQRRTNLPRVWNSPWQMLVSNAMRSSPCSQSKTLVLLKVKADLAQPCPTTQERLFQQTHHSSDHV